MESGLHCPLYEIISVFPHLIWCWPWWNIDFIVLRYIPSIPSPFRSLVMKGCWNSSKVFLHLWGRLCDFCASFYLYFIHWCIWWATLNPWNGSMMYYFLMCYWILFERILLRNLVYVFILKIDLKFLFCCVLIQFWYHCNTELHRIGLGTFLYFLFYGIFWGALL
jgi:hypothetical protein